MKKESAYRKIGCEGGKSRKIMILRESPEHCDVSASAPFCSNRLEKVGHGVTGVLECSSKRVIAISRISRHKSFRRRCSHIGKFKNPSSRS